MPRSWIRRRTATASSSSAGLSPASTSSSSSSVGCVASARASSSSWRWCRLTSRGSASARSARPTTSRYSSRRARGPSARLCADAAEHARDRDVVAHGHRLERLRDLVRARDPEVRADVRREPVDAPARRARTAAGGRRVHAREDADQRRLAGAVRADEPDDVAALDVERDACERAHAAEALLDVDALEQRPRSAHRARSPRRGVAGARSRPARPRRRRAPRPGARAAARRSRPRGRC